MSNQESSSTETNLVAKTSKSNSSSWIFGLAVVVIGLLLLAKNLGIELFFLDFHHWWAFFILAAAIQPLTQAWQFYKAEGFSHNMLHSFVSGTTIVFIALIFLLDLPLGTWWPSFIIIGGLYMMTSGKR